MAESAPNKTGRYLSKILKINPVYDAEGIIQLRSHALGLQKLSKRSETAATDSAPSPADQENLRNIAAGKLENIRGRCWQAAPETLLKELGSLPIEQFPDLQLARDRLVAVAQHRSQLPALTSHKHFDGEFFSVLKQVLAGSPRETNVLREQVLASFRSGKLRKRGRRMIKLLKKQMPELYSIEADWLDSLLRQKSVAGGNQQWAGVDGSTESEFNIPGWLIWIVVVITIRVLISIGRGS